MGPKSSGALPTQAKLSIQLQDTPTRTGTHLDLLKNHIPYSLSVLRRLQFMSHNGGSSPGSHIIFATAEGGDQRHFAAAYADLYKAPETQVWLYSTLEDAPLDSFPPEEVDVCVEQVLALLRRCRDLSREAAGTAGAHHLFGDGFIVGALSQTLRDLLLARGVTTSYFNPHDRWLFHVRDLPPAVVARQAGPLSRDMRWDTIRRADVPLIISRTHIPKTEATLMMLPSLGIRLLDGTLIAWSFLGVDGTLSTLHCEEPYRRRGIAKALAAKVIRDHNGDLGSDGWCAADVHIDNKQSQAVCRSIGGRCGWRNSW